MKAKAVVKDVARVVGLGFDEANQLTKLIPSELHITLDKALAQEPELKKRYQSDERVRKIIDIGRRLEGVARNAGVHAAGVVVADQPLVNFLPLYRASGEDALVTQYDGPTVERVGLLKMDFLGLRTLTTLERARRLAEARTGTPIDLEKIDLADQRVYEMFARGETRGVFQFESGGMRDVLMRMKPNRIEDLIAANALFRPGPMEYIPDYVARKHGAIWKTPHPIMTDVLRETYGIMVYQEQVSRIVNRLGGVELKAAFRLAKAISKKKTSMIEAMREPFLNGCVANGVTRPVAEQVFEDILKFGGYAFNKAHSTGYALVAYQTAWMKTYFPLEFMAAVLCLEMSSTEKIAEYREECSAMRIVLEPPDVNRSTYEFVVEKVAGATADQGPRGSLRFGLGAIRGIGEKAVTAMVHERDRGGPFRNLFDFCERVDLTAVNRGTIEALICAGAFDVTGAMRKALFDAVERSISVGQSAQQDRKRGQLALFGGDELGPTDASPQSLGTAEWSEAEMLRREKEVLGFYVTRHPLTNHHELLEACATVTSAALMNLQDGTDVVVGGIVTGLRTVIARAGRNAGKPLGIVTLEDLSGKAEAVLFPDDLQKFRAILVPDAVVFLEGHVDRKREEPTIRVARVIPCAAARETFARMLILNVYDHTPMPELMRLFRDHRGECRVYLDVHADGVYVVAVECNPGVRIRCTDELLQSLLRIAPDADPRALNGRRRAIPLGIHQEASRQTHSSAGLATSPAFDRRAVAESSTLLV